VTPQAANASLSETPQGQTRCACSPSRLHVYSMLKAQRCTAPTPPTPPCLSQLLVPSSKFQAPKPGMAFPNVTLPAEVIVSSHLPSHRSTPVIPVKEVYEVPLPCIYTCLVLHPGTYLTDLSRTMVHPEIAICQLTTPEGDGIPLFSYLPNLPNPANKSSIR
jgi:hypothetical protein